LLVRLVNVPDSGQQEPPSDGFVDADDELAPAATSLHR
jgi:hypothetical protein